MKWVARFGRVMTVVSERFVVDPFVLAVLLAVLVSTAAILVPANESSKVSDPTSIPTADSPSGQPPDPSATAVSADGGDWLQRLKRRTVKMFDAWYRPEGMWSLLRLSMQMALIIVLGFALADAPKIQTFIATIAGAPRSTATAVHLVSSIACIAALVHWGLGLVVGATLARRVALDGFVHHGRRFHYPLLGAAGYSGMLVWHGGLTGSGPLELAYSKSELIRAGIEKYPKLQAIPLSETLFSDLNLVVALVSVIIVPYVFRWLAPRDEEQSRPVDEFLRPEDMYPPAASKVKPRKGWQRVEHSSGIRLGFFAILFIGLIVTVRRQSSLAVNWLDTANAAFFSLALLMHPTLRSFRLSIVSAVRCIAGLIIQFPIYAGIASVMVSARFVEGITNLCACLSDKLFPIAAFLDTCILKIFMPSGGGKFMVQTPLVAKMSQDLMDSPGKPLFDPETWVMSLAYGDQLMNMVQPFWALPLLAIMGLRARHIMGYCFCAMIMTAPVYVIALWLLG